MPRYDVHPAPSGAGLVVDVQTDLLEAISTRVVAPLPPVARAPQSLRRLDPIFDIDGESYALEPRLIGAVPLAALRNPVANVEDRRDEITAALDMLLQGF